MTSMPSAAGVLRRRGAAFALDAMILVAAGTALGALLLDEFMRLGAWGKALGTVASLLYFGWGDSSLSGGATPGKRLMGIRVTGPDGNPISPARAALRALVFLVPWLLEPRCSSCPAAIEAALGVLVYGGGAAIYYLLLFNRRTGRSLHDITSGASVIRSGSSPDTEARTWKGHYVLAAVLAATVAFFICYAEYESVRNGDRDLTSSVAQALMDEPGVRQVHALLGAKILSGTRTPWKFLQLTIRLSRRPEQGLEHEAMRLVDKSIRTNPDALDVEQIGVRISYGYDIGISVSYVTHDEYKSPSEWIGKIRGSGMRP